MSSKTPKDLSKVECLVLEGGGIKVLSFIGILQELEKSIPSQLASSQLSLKCSSKEEVKGFDISKIKKVIGSSAGSLMGFYIACKVPLSVITDECMKQDFSILSTSNNYLLDAFNFVRHYGFDTGDAVKEMVEDIVARHTSSKTTTFEQLFKQTNIEYVVTGTNLSKKLTEYFSYKTTPTMKIVDAVRISMCYPIAFAPIKMNHDYYIDGGFLNNYPIWYFDQEYSPSNANPYQLRMNANPKVLGFKILDEGETVSDLIATQSVNISSIKSYLMSMINGALTQIERGYVKSGYWERTIPVHCCGFSALDFGLSYDQKLSLIEMGSKACISYLQEQGIEE